ncbi:hypothetical protein MMC07_001186 [Pseudocyphellaria aurata]|nr:hypothetical protein [Pseudocyphellaria aurata]
MADSNATVAPPADASVTPAAPTAPTVPFTQNAALPVEAEESNVQISLVLVAQRDDTYYLPNDDKELDRLDLMHQMIRIISRDQLHLAPLDDKKPMTVLDIGTGTGIWAIEMGDQYPLAEIIGTDLSPTQSTWVPPNVKFEVDDCEESWTFPQPFDYIHIRYMIAAIRDWPKLVGQAFQHTKPGGWAEFQDFDAHYYSEDGSMVEGSVTGAWVKDWTLATGNSGLEFMPGRKLEGWMRDAGFVNLRAEKFRVPIGPWPKDKHLKTIGAWNLVQLEDGLEAFNMRMFTQVLGWKPEEVHVLVAKLRQEFSNPRIHMIYNFWIVYGQKPSDGKVEVEPDVI